MRGVIEFSFETQADKIVNGPRNASDRPDNPIMITKIVVREAKADERGPAPTK